MDTRGKHLILDFYDCDPELINDSSFLLEACTSAARKANATILDTHLHKFEPQGISVLIILQESHLSLHSFPEESYVSVDIYSCGDCAEPLNAMGFLKEKFCSQTVIYKNLLRGINRQITDNFCYGKQ